MNGNFLLGQFQWEAVAEGVTEIRFDEVQADLQPGIKPSFDSLTIFVDNDMLMGDINCDGVVNLLDINPFVELIVSNEFMPKADLNFDGVVNLLDAGAFSSLLIP